ncbi:ABC transporter permease subunit [Actinoplanes sp. NPDC049548]|uniref:ABC transporter permease subunit n=1 Tax=Actinoplanes sp. NPDC049548 TaxID=3155152 RepID=UPI003438E1AF
MTWLAIRLLRPYLIISVLISGVSTAFLVHGSAVVQRQLDARGMPGCVNPNLCWPTGPAMNAILGMELVAAFVPVLIGLVLGVPLFAREREEGTVAFVLSQSVSRRRWVVTKLACALVAGGLCTAVVALTYRLLVARYTLLANDLYELLELLHLNHVGFMVMQTVFTTAVAGLLGLVYGRTLRTLVVSLVWWPFGVAAVYAGVALLPVAPGSGVAGDSGFSPDDDRYWTADISYADGFGYAATVLMIVYVVTTVLLARRVGRRLAV